MNIQSNINQTISLAGFLMSRMPQVEIRQKGLGFQAQQEQATRGLQDIESNVNRAYITKKLESAGVEPEQAKYMTKEALESYVEPKDDSEVNAISEFMNLGPKTYNKQEFEDIEDRTREYQKNIYDAKVAALDPRYSKYVDPQHIRQGDLSKTLSNIRTKTGFAKEALAAKQEEAKPSKRYINSMTEVENG